MEEKSMTRNHEGGIIAKGIIEKDSLKGSRGGGIHCRLPLPPASTSITIELTSNSINSESMQHRETS
jgi:hypothetical protein